MQKKLKLPFDNAGGNYYREIWEGPRCGVENVSELFGIDEVDIKLSILSLLNAK